jgi:hypothetical protein
VARKSSSSHPLPFTVDAFHPVFGVNWFTVVQCFPERFHCWSHILVMQRLQPSQIPCPLFAQARQLHPSGANFQEIAIRVKNSRQLKIQFNELLVVFFTFTERLFRPLARCNIQHGHRKADLLVRLVERRLHRSAGSTALTSWIQLHYTPRKRQRAFGYFNFPPHRRQMRIYFQQAGRKAFIACWRAGKSTWLSTEQVLAINFVS